MAFLDVEFSPEELKAAGENRFELLPAGNYIAQIVKSEIKVNKDGFGSRLSMQFQITDGDKRGRTLFQDVTLKNQNETAMKIGREQLAQLARGREFEPFDRSLDVQISRLRKMIEADPASPKIIQTVWGVGYVFVPDGQP